MKRLLSIVMLLLSVVGIYADNPVTVKAGNPVVFNETSQALVVVDYSKTMVKDQTLDAYLIGCPVRCSEKQMLKSPVKLLI